MRAIVTLAAVGAMALAVTPAAEARTVTVKKTGRSVGVKVGDKVVVSVAENPSTGYAWKVTSRPPFLKLQSSKYTMSGGLPGAGGHRVFTYGVMKKGSGQLKLVYRRSFAPSAGDTKFIVKVLAKA